MYSEPVPFTWTDYYDQEMGPGLNRRVAAFAGLRLPGELVAVKRRCMALEMEMAVAGRRVVNLDPGLLGRDALVLATHKYGGHRLELAPGIYGEVDPGLFARGITGPCPGPTRITRAKRCGSCWGACAPVCCGALKKGRNKESKLDQVHDRIWPRARATRARAAGWWRSRP